MMVLRCPKHPKYKAKLPPRVHCTSCKRLWRSTEDDDGLVKQLVGQGAPKVFLFNYISSGAQLEISEESGDDHVVLYSRAEIDRLIDLLRQARKYVR